MTKCIEMHIENVYLWAFVKCQLLTWRLIFLFWCNEGREIFPSFLGQEYCICPYSMGSPWEQPMEGKVIHQTLAHLFPSPVHTPPWTLTIRWSESRTWVCETESFSFQKSVGKTRKYKDHLGLISVPTWFYANKWLAICPWPIRASSWGICFRFNKTGWVILASPSFYKHVTRMNPVMAAESFEVLGEIVAI